MVLTFKLEGTCEEVVSLLPELNFYVLQKGKDKYSVWAPLSISEFVVFSLKLKEKPGIEEKVGEILQKLKVIFPECFGEI